MRFLPTILRFILVLCALPLLTSGALGASGELVAAGELDVSGPAQSITARTLVVRDEIGSQEPWSVWIEAESADVIVLGLPIASDEYSNEIEIPFVVVVSADGAVDSTATIIVVRGTQVILTELIQIHRTPNPADLNRDGRVDAVDLTVLLSNWGRCVIKRGECIADIDGDGWVDGRDVSILVASWHS